MAERAPSGYPKTERESAVYWLGVADALILAFAEAGSEESKAAAKRMERTYPGAAAGVMAIASMRAKRLPRCEHGFSPDVCPTCVSERLGRG